MKDYTKVYATIFWISLASIFIWLVLKALGYINTPLFVELFPLFSAIFAGGAFFQMIIGMKSRLSRIEFSVREHERRLVFLEHSPLKNIR